MIKATWEKLKKGCEKRRGLDPDVEGSLGLSWRKRFTDNIADNIRFIACAFLLMDLVVLAAFTLWFTGKFVWFLGGWVRRVFFSSPW